MCTDDTLCSIILETSDELEVALRPMSPLYWHKTVKQIDELTFIYLHIAVAKIGFRCLFVETNRAQRRMREHYCGHIVIIHFQSRPVIKKPFRQDSAGAHRNRCQCDALCDISDSVNPRLGGVLVLVCYNVTTSSIYLD